MLFPELVSPGKYKQVKIGREEIKKTLVRMGRFYLSYVEQENLLPRSFPPEIPNKTPFPLLLLIRFHKKNYSSCCPQLYSFHPDSSSRLAILCTTFKRQTSFKGTIKNSLSWSGPADSHFVHSFFHKCVVFNYQPGWPSSAATWFEWGACVLRVGCLGKVVR